MYERADRDLRLVRLENTSGGRRVRTPRSTEQMKMEMRERREKRNTREIMLSRPSKTAKGREERLLEEREIEE